MPSRTKEPPYLTHTISHLGRVTLVPPDNAGRIRKPSTNEKSGRRHFRSQRNEQQEGGSANRTTQSPGTWDAAIPSRRLFEDTSRYSIPNYPPPSFQEAMASPPVSVSSAASTMIDSTSYQSMLQNAEHDPSLASELNLTEEELSRLSTTASHGSAIIAVQSNPPSPDSDTSSVTSSSSSSIEIIDTPLTTRQTQPSERRPWDNSPPSPRDLTYSVVERESEDEDQIADPLPNPGHHHRSLSLSPLRTLLPSHRSSSHGTGSFLRSSTSTSNLLSRAASSPFFRSTTTLGSPTSESPRKKIFSHRVRERRGSGDEPMDAWEMLDAASGTESSSSSSSRPSIIPPRNVRSYSASQQNAMRRTPPPPPIHIPHSYSASPVLQIQRTESPPIVTVRTRRYPPNSRVHVSSPLAHDVVLETALNVPLPSTPGGYSNAEPETPVVTTPPTPRRHYPGRPLPRPPGIDGAAAHLLTRPLTPPVWVSPLPPQYHITAPTPTTPQRSAEDLLIDFRESAVLETPVATPQTPRREYVDLLSDTSDEPEMMATPPQSPMRASPPPPRTPTTPTTPQSRSPLPQGPYSQMTDLEALAATISDEGMQTGQEYETLLLIAEFNGPVSPTRARRNALAAPSPSSSAASTVIFPSAEPSQSPFIQGSIELERRRVTKEGRVKLKLSLLGFAVDKCGICISQFKKGEVGAKGRNCLPGHAFHGSCLQQWVAATTGEPRCPVCRKILKA